MKTKIFFIGAVALFSVEAIAQEEQYGATPEQQRACMEALSVYRSFRDQENFKDAYASWRSACKECPENVSERLYSDGVKFIKEEFKQSQKTGDKTRMFLLTDSLFWTYDMRIKHFPTTDKNPNNGCEIKAYKASDILTFKPGKPDDARILFKESLDCTGENSSPIALSGYYVALHKLADTAPLEADKKQFRSLIIGEYLVVSDYIDKSLARSEGKVKEGYEKAKSNIDEIFVLFAKCEDMLPVLKQKVASEPGNLNLKKKALSLMNKKDCVEDPAYLLWAEEVFATEPGHEAAFSIGMGHTKNGEFSTAMKYLDQAVELCKDCPEEYTYWLKAGQVASAAKSTSKARILANKLIQAGQFQGEAYIILGDIAAASSGACNDVFGGKSVFWVAVDYYETARSKDNEVAEKASKKIAQSKSYWPTKIDVFNNNLSEGAQFSVDCLGATTTIRVAK